MHVGAVLQFWRGMPRRAAPAFQWAAWTTLGGGGMRHSGWRRVRHFTGGGVRTLQRWRRGGTYSGRSAAPRVLRTSDFAVARPDGVSKQPAFGSNLQRTICDPRGAQRAEFARVAGRCITGLPLRNPGARALIAANGGTGGWQMGRPVAGGDTATAATAGSAAHSGRSPITTLYDIDVGLRLRSLVLDYGYNDILCRAVRSYGYDDLTGYLRRAWRISGRHAGKGHAATQRLIRRPTTDEMCGDDSRDIAGLRLIRSSRLFSPTMSTRRRSTISPTPR